ncbi:MAG: OmpA family protein [Phycisphaerales bacterium]
MNARARILVVAVVWLTIIFALALGWRFVISPMLGAKAATEELRTEYAELQSTASQRGVDLPPMPDDISRREAARLVDEARTRLTSRSGGTNGGATSGRGASGDGSSSASSSGAGLTPVRIALDSFSGYAIFRSDTFEQRLAERGFRPILVDDEADYAVRLAGLESGDTPLAVFPIDAMVTAAAERGTLPGSAIMLVDETIGADAIVAWERGVPDLDALNAPDARFVLTPSSPSETLARVVMNSFDLGQLPDRPFIAVDGAEAVYERFVAAPRDERRAYALWEPYVSKALEEPGARILADTGRLRGFVVDALVASRDALLRDEPMVRAVVESYLSALYAIEGSGGGMPAQLQLDALATGQRLTAEQSARLAAGVQWKNTQENYVHFGLRSGALPPLERLVRRITGVLIATGAIDADPAGGDPSRLVYDRILAGLQQDGFHPSIGGAGADEPVRGAISLAALSDGQWTDLRPVGTLGIERLVFARGTARLTGSAEASLERLAERLDAFPQYYITVRGHALAIGDPEANRRLARARADAVAAALTERGVAEVRVRATSTAPETGGSAAAGRSVSFVVGERPY